MTSLHPTVSHIVIYPIKSLDGVTVDRRPLLEKGGLVGDREFAIVDESGRLVNGKRTPMVHHLRARFNLDERSVSLQVQDDGPSELFHLDSDRSVLEHWLSDYFQMTVHLIQNCETGFPDDQASPGPTLVSTATLEAIASWYPNLDLDEARRRFRTNIEISGVPAFWEDQLFTETDQGRPFQIGTVSLVGVNPCQRCVVVTRNSQTGEQIPNFQSIFNANRNATLPAWAARSRFNHFFRLAINTRPLHAEAGKEIQVGDEVYIAKSPHFGSS